MSSYGRDVRELKKSLRVLDKYIELCKSGDYDFAVDIPTQIYKSFFDKNERNNHQTLFERVCSHNNVVVKFHPAREVLLAIIFGWTFNTHITPSYSDENGRTQYGELFDFDRPPIHFVEWQNQIVQIVVFGNIAEEKLKLSANKGKSSNEDVHKDLAQLAIQILDIFVVLKAETLSKRGYTIKLSPTQQQWKRKMADEAHVNGGKSLIQGKITQLSICDLFRIVRHKDSAHSDPLTEPKYEEEYDEFYATKAITFFEDESETTYEKLIVNIAEYMVKRSNEELSEVFAKVE